VILASFDNRHAAEHVLASLGRGFREKHRKGHAMALVVSGNKDGSVKVTQSRVLSGGGVVYTVIRVSLSWTVGFMGLVATLRGGRGAAHEVREHESHAGSDEQVHAILARAGPSAALVLVRTDDEDVRRAVVAKAADRASESWEGSFEEFLAALDPGSNHDWVRAAVGKPS
jgi:hypothetical protein